MRRAQKNKKYDKVKLIVNSETPHHSEIERNKSMISGSKYK